MIDALRSMFLPQKVVLTLRKIERHADNQTHDGLLTSNTGDRGFCRKK
jgi:hypothetical protein